MPTIARHLNPLAFLAALVLLRHARRSLLRSQALGEYEQVPGLAGLANRSRRRTRAYIRIARRHLRPLCRPLRQLAFLLA